MTTETVVFEVVGPLMNSAINGAIIMTGIAVFTVIMLMLVTVFLWTGKLVVYLIGWSFGMVCDYSYMFREGKIRGKKYYQGIGNRGG